MFLLSCGPQLASIAADVAVVRDQINSLAEEGKDIVLAMHSYGARVGSWVSLSQLRMTLCPQDSPLYLSSVLLVLDLAAREQLRCL